MVRHLSCNSIQSGHYRVTLETVYRKALRVPDLHSIELAFILFLASPDSTNDPRALVIMSVNRRTFAKHLAAGAIASAPAAALSAGEPVDDNKPEPTGAGPNPPAPADLLLELIKRHYPTNLDDAKLAQIRGQIEHHMARSKVLSTFPLTNADEPAPVFTAWRAED